MIRNELALAGFFFEGFYPRLNGGAAVVDSFPYFCTWGCAARRFPSVERALADFESGTELISGDQFVIGKEGYNGAHIGVCLFESSD